MSDRGSRAGEKRERRVRGEERRGRGVVNVENRSLFIDLDIDKCHLVPEKFCPYMVIVYCLILLRLRYGK